MSQVWLHLRTSHREPQAERGGGGKIWAGKHAYFDNPHHITRNSRNSRPALSLVGCFLAPPLSPQADAIRNGVNGPAVEFWGGDQNDQQDTDMKPPICRTCGEAHWSRLCYTDRVERHAPRDTVTPDVTFSHTVTEPVTRDVTTVVTPRQADLEDALKRLHAENERLEEEVRQLKHQLAGKAPMTDAERQRRSRERKKQA